MARKYDHSPSRRQTARRLTANQEEWQHQVTNLKRRIRELEKKGYEVEYEVPEQPKRITKESIERVRKISRKELLEYAPEKQGPPKPPKRLPITDVELKRLREFIQNYENGNVNKYSLQWAKDYLTRILDNAIQTYGEREIAIRAEQIAAATDFAVQAMQDSHGDIQQQYIDSFAYVLFDRSFTQSELRDIEEARERNENYE